MFLTLVKDNRRLVLETKFIFEIKDFNIDYLLLDFLKTTINNNQLFDFFINKNYTYKLENHKGGYKFFGMVLGILWDDWDEKNQDRIKYIRKHYEDIKSYLYSLNISLCNPYEIKYKENDLIYIKNSTNVIRCLLYYKNNSIERFVKHKLFDKNVLGIINSF
jgi:hypothetical protein